MLRGGIPAAGFINASGYEVDGVRGDPEIVGPTSLSGATVDTVFTRTGISRIDIMIDTGSLSGTDEMLIRIGSGSIETTGYYGNAGAETLADVVFSTPNAFQIGLGQANAGLYTGFFILEHATGNLWHFRGQLVDEGNVGIFAIGQKTLAGALDRIQFLATGANTYDAGNVTYRLW